MAEGYDISGDRCSVRLLQTEQTVPVSFTLLTEHHFVSI